MRPCEAGWPPDCLTRVQTEVADQLLRAAKATEVTDGGDDRQRHGRVDAGDRHQPLDVVASQRDTAELGIDDPQLLAVEVQLAQQRRDGLALIGRQRLLGQPAPALVAEQVSGGAARDQVAAQDRLDLVLQPGPLAHDMPAPRHLAAQRVRHVIGQPDAGQVVRRQQLREHLGVDLVSLDLGLGDRAGLLRV
jgi:hypothetical protein